MTIGYYLLAALGVGILVIMSINRLHPDVRNMNSARRKLSYILRIKPYYIARMMADLGPDKTIELSLMMKGVDPNNIDFSDENPLSFIYGSCVFVFFFHWCLCRNSGDVHWLYHQLVKQGITIDKICVDKDVLSVSQSILENIDLRGYDLCKFHENLSSFLAEYEGFLEGERTRERPTLILH